MPKQKDRDGGPIQTKGKAKLLSIAIDEKRCDKGGRCTYYCPANAIKYEATPGVCTHCDVCMDVCPVGAIKNSFIDYGKCVSCYTCVRKCINNAIVIENHRPKIIKGDSKRKLYYCNQCGLCVEACPTDALKWEGGRIRFDSVKCINCNLCVKACPTKIKISEREKMFTGHCIVCGICTTVCKKDAIKLNYREWQGEHEGCIQCGICKEVCPTKCIEVDLNGFRVDLEKCVMCETCGAYCPVQCLPRKTRDHKEIKSGTLTYNDDLCIMCEQCVKICPSDAISVKSKKLVFDMKKCIRCGACDNICPAYAINVQTDFEDRTINGRSK